MPFVRTDLEALIGILRDDARARSEFRQLVFPEESVEGRLDSIDRRLDSLTEAVQQLAEAQRRTELRVEELARNMDRLTGKFGNFEGRMLEWRYRERAGAYFGRLIRPARVVDVQVVLDRIESVLAPSEIDEVFELDLLVAGSPRGRPDAGEVWIALEILAVVDRADVQRASRRAELLARIGQPVVAAAAGERATAGALEEARALRVAHFEDGRVAGWEEALARALEG